MVYGLPGLESRIESSQIDGIDPRTRAPTTHNSLFQGMKSPSESRCYRSLSTVCCHLPKTNIALSNSFPSSSRLNSNWTLYIHSTPFGILRCESERYSRRTVSKHVDPVFVIGNCREE